MTGQGYAARSGGCAVARVVLRAECNNGSRDPILQSTTPDDDNFGSRDPLLRSGYLPVCFLAADPPLPFLLVEPFLAVDPPEDFLAVDPPDDFLAALFLVLDVFDVDVAGCAFLRGGSLSPGPAPGWFGPLFLTALAT